MNIKDSLKSLNINRINVDSLWVFHYDGSGCDGCNAEFLACLSPKWDIERLAVRNTGNPAYADILLVTGLIDESNESELLEIYNQMPKHSKVIASGACACTGGMFTACDNIRAGVDSIIPVDLYVAGCATRPEAIIDGLIKIKSEKHNSETQTTEGGSNEE